VNVVGLLLAAGEGRRMGGPKALLRDAQGVTFLDRTLRVLLDGGCASVTVVLGASSDEVRAVLGETVWAADEAVSVVVADDWALGMGASLRTGLGALPRDADGALVTLVDLPDVGDAVVRRVLGSGVLRSALARASYDGRVGHPVLIGADHWAGVAATASGDRGARDYLATHEVTLVECGDLASGRDVDSPADLA
jgi:CTP:molybdopterin cytidylyltransferase MocA